ncbi:MAG: SDR family oxidoreductase [Spirochaetia bacterium]|nr:SDR family oxidoreductase [Spirochaetia bacterium]
MKDITIITGGTEGFGRELASHFAADGHRLLLVARRLELLKKTKEELESQYPIEVFIFTADLTTQEGRLSVKEYCEANEFHVDVLVNNAGMGTGGAFHEISAEKETMMIRLNVEAVNDMIHLFLPAMIEAKKGIIMNAASAASFQPGPYMAAYYACKAYVLSLTEALAAENKKTGVRVCCYCPGPCATPFLKKAETDTLFDPKRNKGMKPPAVIINRVYKEFKKGKTVIIPEKKFAFLRFLQRLVPRSLLLHVMVKVNTVKD